MVNTRFISQALKRKDGFFRKVYDFNYNLLGRIEGSWLEDLVGSKELGGLMRGRERIGKRVNEYLLGKLGLGGDFFYRFEEPRARLVLLEGGVMERLIVLAGAGVMAAKCQRIIQKEKLREVKENVGEEGYYFMTKRGRLYEGYVPGFLVGYRERELDFGVIEEVGRRCIAGVLGDLSEGYLKRLEIRFRRGIEWDYEVNGEEQRVQGWNYLYRILSKELKEEAEICFI